MSHSIFLVDDHPLVLEGLVRLIHQQPDMHVAGTALSASQALEAIPRSGASAVIADLSLKDESGFELIQALKERCPGVAVLVLTMHEETSCAERAMAAGARGFLTKSQGTDEVLVALRQVLQGKIYMNEALLAHLLTRGARPTTPETLLSPREIAIFELLGKGYKTHRIASLLDLSPKTVDSHCANIKTKLKLHDANELVRNAVLWVHGRSAEPG